MREINVGALKESLYNKEKEKKRKEESREKNEKWSLGNSMKGANICQLRSHRSGKKRI